MKNLEYLFQFAKSKNFRKQLPFASTKNISSFKTSKSQSKSKIVSVKSYEEILKEFTNQMNKKTKKNFSHELPKNLNKQIKTFKLINPSKCSKICLRKNNVKSNTNLYSLENEINLSHHLKKVNSG